VEVNSPPKRKKRMPKLAYKAEMKKLPPYHGS
jgi:hypothetical protein